MSRKDPDRKNKRAKAVRKKILRVRTALRAERKVKRETAVLQEEIRKITNPGITIRNSTSRLTSQNTDVILTE